MIDMDTEDFMVVNRNAPCFTLFCPSAFPRPEQVGSPTASIYLDELDGPSSFALKFHK